MNIQLNVVFHLRQELAEFGIRHCFINKVMSSDIPIVFFNSKIFSWNTKKAKENENALAGNQYFVLGEKLTSIED